jgi:photosystem II stability/assembly factor-like uncharacterized protein
MRIPCLLTLSLIGCQTPTVSSTTWTEQTTGSTAHFRGLHVIDDNTVWASGSAGTILLSKDGGSSFHICKVPGEEAGELRDIHGFDANHAVFLACQPARIYRTRNGGRSFEKLYESTNPKAFLDGIAFFDASRGLAFGDALGKRFQLLDRHGGQRRTCIPFLRLRTVLDNYDYALALRTIGRSIFPGLETWWPHHYCRR